MAERIQRKRTKGWRMPEGAIYVGRPTKFGNGFVVGRYRIGSLRNRNEFGIFCPGGAIIICETLEEARSKAVERYCEWLMLSAIGSFLRDAVRSELRGKDLACWCPLDAACHADVLLEVANG